jgi:uncharacterized protein (TIGR02466 family)
MNFENLFPTPIGSTFLDREFTQVEMDYFTLDINAPYPNTGNKTSHDTYVLENKALKDVKQFCESAVNEYFKEIYQPSLDISLYITQSWVNFTNPNEYHHGHTHRNSIISGCLYIDVEKETDKITFFKNNDESIHIESSNYNMYNSEFWWFNVENKKLLLFPSKLKHCVDRTDSKKTRISLAFNTFLKGEIGNQRQLTRLKL